MLRYLKLKRSSKRKDREISLTAQDENESFSVKIPQSILAEHSQIFHDMTKVEIKKSHKSILEGVTVAALKKVVEYTKQGDVTFQNHLEALETLKAAEKYKFGSLEKICGEYLVVVMDSSNVCDIFEVALALSLSHLLYFCLRHIDSNILDVFSSRSFLSLQKSTVREIISRNSLNVSSEKAIFDAVLGWGLNDILRKGLDPNNQEELMRTIKSLLSQVRFSAMSNEELGNSEVIKYQTLMISDGPWRRQRTTSGMSQSSTGTVDSLLFQPRHYVSSYVANLNVHESVQHTIKVGEVFCLRIEILKGTVFLSGVNLAMRAFAPTKDTACLYVVIIATNVLTMEQVTKRGAFLNTSEKASLLFPTPLVAKESERIEIALSVKRAENICPLSVGDDVQIVMPECQKVAMKIVPPAVSAGADESGRCIFREIEYFF